METFRGQRLGPERHSLAWQRRAKFDLEKRKGWQSLGEIREDLRNIPARLHKQPNKT